MPAPASPSRPTLDADCSNIRDYLLQISILANEAGIPGQAAINWARFYAPKEQSALWFSLPEASQGNLDLFTDAVLKLYPEPDDSVSAGELETLLARNRQVSCPSPSEFAAYFRDFTRMKNNLLAARRMTTMDVPRKFRQGLSPYLAQELHRYQQVIDPAGTWTLDASLEQLNEHIQIVLRRVRIDPTAEQNLPLPAVPSSSSNQPPATSSAPTQDSVREQLKEISDRLDGRLRIKQEPPASDSHFDKMEKKLQSFSERLDAMLAATQSRPAPSSQPSGRAPAQSSQQRFERSQQSSQQPRDRCFICNSSNHLRVLDCPVRDDALNKGYARVGDRNRLVAADGVELRNGAPGSCVMDRLHEYYRQNPSALPQGVAFPYRYSPAAGPSGQRTESANLLEARFPAIVSRTAWDELPSSSDLTNDPACIPSPSAPTPPSDPLPSSGEAFAARRYVGKPPPEAGAFRPVREPTPPVDTSGPSGILPPGPKQAQYTNFSPSADSAAVDSIFGKILSSEVVLSVRDVLAASPEIRKRNKEYISFKRTPLPASQPAQAEAMYSFGPRPRSPPVADESLEEPVAPANAPLRFLEIHLDGKVSAQGLLDQGASFIAVSREMWMKLGSPSLQQSSIIIETANGTRSQSLGLIPRLRIAIDGFSILVKAQIVEDAPFDVLLGRPFFIHCQAESKDDGTNFQSLQLRHPVTGEVVLVPTMERLPGSFRPHSDEDDSFL